MSEDFYMNLIFNDISNEPLMEMAKPFSKEGKGCPPISVNPTKGGHLKYFKVYSENSQHPRFVAHISFMEEEYVPDHEQDKYGAIPRPMTKEMREQVYTFLKETSKTFKIIKTGKMGTHWEQLISFYNGFIPDNEWTQEQTENYLMNNYNPLDPHIPFDKPMPNYMALQTCKGKK